LSYGRGWELELATDSAGFHREFLRILVLARQAVALAKAGNPNRTRTRNLDYGKQHEFRLQNRPLRMRVCAPAVARARTIL